MDKYKTLKRLVLFNALFSVLCFFLPIVWLNGIENIGLGFSFVIGITVSKPSSPLYQDSYLAYVQSARLYEWLMRISFILAIASLVLAVLLFIKKYNNGSNKKKVDITILVSVALSLVSALLIFSILPISISIRGVVSPEGFYGYEPIITFVITAVIAVLFVKSKREIATAEGAPQVETVSPVASSNASSQITRVNAGTVSSQTAVPSGAHKTQKNYMEDKPMTKKDAEAILAYIWVRQYNNLPFDEALDKIMAYLIENKYVITPETAAELSKSVSADEDVSGDIPAANECGYAFDESANGKSVPLATNNGAWVGYGKASKNMRLARQAREENNSEDAKLYYGKVREEDPESGEAKFYYAYYSLHEGKNIELQKRFGNLCTILPVSIKRIKESAMESAEQYKIIKDIVNSFAPEAWAEISYMRHMNIEEKVGDSYVTVFEENEIRMIYLLGSDALDALGEQIDALSVSDPEYKKIASVAWEEYLALQQNWYKYKKGSTDLKIIMTSFKELGDRLGDDPAYKKIALEAWSEFVTFAQKFYALVEKGEAEIYAEKIKKLDPSYIMPKKSGCISKA